MTLKVLAPGCALPAATAKDPMGASAAFTFADACLAVDESNGLTVETR